MLARTGALSLTGVLLVSLLTGCASETEDYCGALEDQKQALTDLAEDARDPQTDLFANSLEIFEDLRDRAPGDIADEWDTFIYAWEGVAEAFDEAGVSARDYRPGDTSGAVSAEDARSIQDAAAELGSPRVVEAGDGIEQHARDVCQVDLGLKPGAVR